LRASASSQHKYIGTDVESELFPSGLPNDLTLVKHSFLDPWPSGWNGTFDLVHQRLGLAGAGQVPLRKVVEGLAGLCKSGGWVELAEMDVQNIPAGNGPALSAALRLLREASSAAGPGGDIASRLKSLLEGAGLEKVEERRIKCSVGSKAKSHLVEKSVNGLCDFIAPMTAEVESKHTYL
jgi:gliotoxin biosynthesis N-methyltransferase